MNTGVSQYISNSKRREDTTMRTLILRCFILGIVQIGVNWTSSYSKHQDPVNVDSAKLFEKPWTRKSFERKPNVKQSTNPLVKYEQQLFIGSNTTKNLQNAIRDKGNDSLIGDKTDIRVFEPMFKYNKRTGDEELTNRRKRSTDEQYWCGEENEVKTRRVTAPFLCSSASSSCQGYCGESSYMAACYCDQLCLVYQDCCFDFAGECPHIVTSNVTNRLNDTTIYVECFEFLSQNKKSQYTKFNMSVIVGCPSSHLIPLNTKELCLDNTNLMSIVPVQDSDTGAIYRNYFCALCHDVTNIKLLEFEIRIIENDAENSYRELYESIDDLNVLNRLLARNAIVLHLLQSVGNIQNRNCEKDNIQLVSDCPFRCGNSSVNSLCHSKQTIVNKADMFYKNEYCALCHNQFEFNCDPDPDWFKTGTARNEPGINKLEKARSFSLLLDFNPSGGLNVGFIDTSGVTSSSKLTATCDESNGCQISFSCEPNFSLINGHCIDAKMNTTISVEITNAMNDSLDNAEVTDWVVSIVRPYFPNNSLIGTEISDQPKLTINVTFQYPTMTPSCSDLITVARNISLKMQKLLQPILNGNLQPLSKFPANIIDSKISVFTNADDIRKLLCENDGRYQSTCVETAYNSDEYYISENGSLVFIKSDMQIAPDDFFLKNGTLFLCDSENTTKAQTDILGYSGYVSTACLTLSSICLLVRIGLQFIVPRYQTFPGLMQFNMILSLFFAGVIFLIRSFFYNIYIACYVFGVLTQFFYLSVFTWIFSLSFELWRTFSSLMVFDSGESKKRRLVVYLTLAWLSPAFLTIITIACDFFLDDVRFRARYAENGLCWFSQRYALLVFFAAPLGIIYIIILCFFVLTVHHIRHSVSHISQITSKVQTSQIYTYIKLSVLLGLTWIVGFIDGFVQIEALSYVVAVLNGSQGVFIFVAFVCTKQIWQSLRKGYVTTTKKQEKSKSTSFTNKSAD